MVLFGTPASSTNNNWPPQNNRRMLKVAVNRQLVAKIVNHKHEVLFFLLHIRISTINASSVMLGIETVFGRPYSLTQFSIDSWILKSRNGMNGLYRPGEKYNTSSNEININKSKLKTTFKPMIALDKNCNLFNVWSFTTDISLITNRFHLHF